MYMYMYICMCMCVCTYIYIYVLYIYIYTHDVASTWAKDDRRLPGELVTRGPPRTKGRIIM